VVLNSQPGRGLIDWLQNGTTAYGLSGRSGTNRPPVLRHRTAGVGPTPYPVAGGAALSVRTRSALRPFRRRFYAFTAHTTRPSTFKSTPTPSGWPSIALAKPYF